MKGQAVAVIKASRLTQILPAALVDKQRGTRAGSFGSPSIPVTLGSTSIQGPSPSSSRTATSGPSVALPSVRPSSMPPSISRALHFTKELRRADEMSNALSWRAWTSQCFCLSQGKHMAGELPLQQLQELRRGKRLSRLQKLSSPQVSQRAELNRSRLLLSRVLPPMEQGPGSVWSVARCLCGSGVDAIDSGPKHPSSCHRTIGGSIAQRSTRTSKLLTRLNSHKSRYRWVSAPTRSFSDPNVGLLFRSILRCTNVDLFGEGAFPRRNILSDYRSLRPKICRWSRTNALFASPSFRRQAPCQ